MPKKRPQREETINGNSLDPRWGKETRDKLLAGKMVYICPMIHLDDNPTSHVLRELGAVMMPDREHCNYWILKDRYQERIDKEAQHGSEN